MRICIAFEEDRRDYGTFYIESKDVSFPYKNWEDFHVSIILYWIRKVLENDQRDYAEFKVAFMEGPYYLLCQKYGDQVRVSAGQEGVASFENYFLEIFSYLELKTLLYNVVEDIIQNATDKTNKSIELTEIADFAKKLL